MYKDFIKVKGVDLTVGDIKKYNKINRLYDDDFIDSFFDGYDDNEKVLIAAEGWAEEKNGFTILFEEITI